MSNLQERINDECNNLVALPDPLTSEQRDHLKSLKGNEIKKYIEECIKENSKVSNPQ